MGGDVSYWKYFSCSTVSLILDIQVSTRRHQLAIFKFCKSANFLRDKCANGPRTNFRLTTLSILQNINFSERVSRKLFNELFNFLSELLTHASPFKVCDTIYGRKYLQQYTKLSNTLELLLGLNMVDTQYFIAK